MKDLILQGFEGFRDFLAHYTYEQWERFIIWIICTGGVYRFVHFREDRELRRGFKGENGMWEAPEAIIYGWFWVWPIMITTSYLFQWVIPDQIWEFLEIILYVALGIRGVMEGAKIIKRGNGSHSSTTTTTSPTTEGKQPPDELEK